MVKLTRWNGHGTGWKVAHDSLERFAELRVYASGGHVEVWAELRLFKPSQNPEALQYLEPREAVSIALGFMRCALRAAWQGRR